MPQKDCRVAYCTDVEGNLNYFLEWVKRSQLVEYSTQGERIILNFKKTDSPLASKFIFGGDICDKGEGSLRCIEAILDFKKRHPNDVVIIMGNRDVNKMRFTSELDDSVVGNPELLDRLPGPYFVKGPARVTPKHFLVRILEEKGITEAKDPAKFKQELHKIDTKANRIKYMLDCTMGSQGDFERRRTELEILKKKKQVTDEEVVESYISSVQPKGILREYLRQGVLAHYEPSISALFVHGGVPEPFGPVPGQEHKETDLQHWVNSLNKWFISQLNDWEKKPLWVKGREGQANPPEGTQDWSARGGNQLMGYGCPEFGAPTVIYMNMFSPENNIQEVSRQFAVKLNSLGVKRIVVGHQPHGVCPSIMKMPELEVIAGDTSYSDMKCPDNRGKAVSTILISPTIVQVQGVIADGSEISYQLATDVEGGDKYVGRKVKFEDQTKGWWVKAKLAKPKADGSEYILQKVDGFKVDYAYCKVPTLQTPLDLGTSTMAARQSNPNTQVLQVPLGKKEVPLRTSDPKVDLKGLCTQFPPFVEWMGNLASEPRLNLSSVQVDYVDTSGPSIEFAKVSVSCTAQHSGRHLPGNTLIRGTSIIIWFIIRTSGSDQRYVLLVSNCKIMCGKFEYHELPWADPNIDGSLGGFCVSLLDRDDFHVNDMKSVDLTDDFYGAKGEVINYGADASNGAYKVLFFEEVVSGPQLAAILEVDSDERKRVDRGEPFLFAVPVSDVLLKTRDAKSFVAQSLYQAYRAKTSK